MGCSLQKKLETELRRMWSESDTQMIMAVVDEELGVVAQRIRDEIDKAEFKHKEAARSIPDKDIEDMDSDELLAVDSEAFSRGYLHAKKQDLGLLVEGE